MAFALSEFKTNLSGGGAKSALFEVNLSYPTPVTSPPVDAKFLISAATIPASTVGTYDIFYHGKAIKVASDRTYESTWDTTIINDENFGIRNTLERWMSLLSNHELNTRSNSVTSVKKEGKNADYKTDISVTQYSKNGTKIQKYKFIGAFPSALSTIALSWSTSEIETYTCGWTYDCWEHEDLTTGEVITNVQSLTGTTTGF